MHFLYLFLFGYRRVSFSKDIEYSLANSLLRLGICAKIKNGSLILSLADAKRLCKDPIAEALVFSKPCGTVPALTTLSHRYFTVTAMVFAIFLNVFLSGVVFDVRISGNNDVPSYKIRAALEEAGVSCGRRFSALNTSEIELELLRSLDSIAWVNINRRGTVLYVEVVERKGGGIEVNEDKRPSNIVAACDCVIEEITVKSGRAVVSVGDVVRAGDILISGVVDTEGGTSFMNAEGTVIGSVTGTVTGKAERNETLRVGYDTECVELRLNILNFSANIFKNCGNYSEECDIIIDNESFSLPHGKRLPVGYTRTLSVKPITEAVCYTDSDMILIAYERHAEALDARLAACQLVSIKTVGEMGDGAYTVTSSVLYITEVGEKKWIELSGDK